MFKFKFPCRLMRLNNWPISFWQAREMWIPGEGDRYRALVSPSRHANPRLLRFSG